MINEVVAVGSTTAAPALLSGAIDVNRDAEEAERRRARLARNGWPADAACAWCGDGGKPEFESYCGCAAGVALRRFAHVERLWEGAIPARLRGYRLDGAPNRSAAARARRWAEAAPDGEPPRRNLLLHGPVGTGKTGIAAGALRLVLERALLRRVAFAGVPAMLDGMRPGGDSDPMDRCQRADVLVLDDLGVERGTEWVRERLFVLVNHRYEAGLPTIVTTNADLPGLAAALGERTVSRLAEEVDVVLVDGPDRRRQ